MHVRDLERLIRVAGSLIKVIKGLRPSFGIVHKAKIVEKEGTVKGYLVWNYLSFNEISFIEVDGNNHQTLFSSTCNKETEEQFEILCNEYEIA